MHLRILIPSILIATQTSFTDTWTHLREVCLRRVYFQDRRQRSHAGWEEDHQGRRLDADHQQRGVPRDRSVGGRRARASQASVLRAEWGRYNFQRPRPPYKRLVGGRRDLGFNSFVTFGDIHVRVFGVIKKCESQREWSDGDLSNSMFS